MERSGLILSNKRIGETNPTMGPPEGALTNCATGDSTVALNRHTMRPPVAHDLRAAIVHAAT